ncbi:ester cyclase [Mucilaginibacter sp. HC2]|uniref:ester cyclase n=1 Tax=Mucilaginibacter inviolabilis TaxID=2714892 RepID=UPI00140AA9F6|nr:ester cyclase [Mucilaginibacter inviolabilis]NHA06181.1 ester cyclase [Mucilaginibacter inviolabilis]
MKATEEFYRSYIDCLNSRNLERLSDFIQDTLTYNGKNTTAKDYKESRLAEQKAIPDLFYHIELLVTNEDTIACRLNFNCTPKSEFMGIKPNGNKAIFSENVFYKLKQGKISSVLSLIDMDTIRKQIG